MCNRGVFQLRLIKLQYCDWGGSSRGIRDLFKTELVEEFLDKNPHLVFEAYMKRGPHPYVYTQYINGWNRTISLRNLKPEEILQILERVRSQTGHSAWKHAGEKVISTNKSIQGPWRPNMWNSLAAYEDQALKDLPEYPGKLKPRLPKEPVADISDEIDKEMRQTIIY